MGFFKPNIDKMEAKKDVEGLIKALKREDFNTRLEAIKALGEIRDKKGAGPLIQVLTAKEEVQPNEQLFAVEALGKIGGAKAIESLIQVLTDKQVSLSMTFSRLVSAWAAEALGEIGDKRATEPLIKALEDQSTDVRVAAAEALGKMMAAQAVEPLTQALESINYRFRKAAAQSLEQIKSAHQAPKPRAEPVKPDARQARVLFDRGTSLEKSGKHEEALWCFKKAVQLDYRLPPPPLWWRCPNCGSILKDDESNRGWAGYVGTVICGACGQQYQAGDIHTGKHDIKSKKPKD